MTTKDEALQMALDALEFSKSYLDELARAIAACTTQAQAADG